MLLLGLRTEGGGGGTLFFDLGLFLNVVFNQIGL